MWHNTGGVLFNAGHFLSIGSLLIAFLIAFLVVVARIHKRTGGLPTPRRILAVLFPRSVFLHGSAKIDYWIFLINQGVLFWMTVTVLLSPALVSELVLGLANWIGLEGGNVETGLAGRVFYSAMLVLLWDFGASWAHYLKHRVPILWELHKVHHSAEVMTPVTAMRRHPIEAVFGSLVSAVVMGTGIAVWVFAFGQSPMPFTIFGTLAGIWVWRMAGYNLRHTHVWISYGDFWNRVFISPAQHQVHHSKSPEHFDTNFGHIFSFWDTLFGTLYLPQKDERVEFGIEDRDMEQFRSLWGVYITPVVKIWRRFCKKPSQNGQVPAE
ncbi:Fatty acid hydroxylase superfamily protein [Falsiruegeria litorea R37]|uniref:Fatty acid hydroxylase superfamily protein n=1 Tax=Falsiruegeria litorea R37 TaxID=1200284 RepID=A0A1Y5TSR7_9RHOB|nr:sterol desaturase family protein [Falsiruegeria litorea]SLN71459.1 Fatty acid hydroxylase superfamily protein [Falsiruegeria litorea R37]